MYKRVVVIVLDGVGVGALPDAAAYGDEDAATLQHVVAGVGGIPLPQLERLGLGNIVPLVGVAPVQRPLASWGKMAEQSAGKDSVTGHWELTGIILQRSFATYPAGFPVEIVDLFTSITGVRPLGNIAASGTDILRDLGEEHLRSKRPIVYTSTDSVFQIAAHEDIIPPAQLYELCRATFDALRPYNICRVIARPFRGESSATFYRTSGRHDFSCLPPDDTLFDRLHKKGIPTCGIGKIGDLFADRGLAQSIPTSDNRMGMTKILAALDHISTGLIMANLVDFDMVYGHRLDVAGFAAALVEVDGWLAQLLPRLEADDLLVITADHGCDPTTPGTDHTREYVPLLVYSPALSKTKDLGIRDSFADLAATLAENFGLECRTGRSFLATLGA
ncbi:phosphopentomutase [Pelovirga terrestris]|uniref:Phosphopentomutase n=1 Tax=Pelovirga terrestris TaxID=2771352 RepID=A0A8J6QLV7_9BACT|nr:phosphopentomutase [Pelovirga terrestris]MBD1399383.1 phosphopentomutase [Pelovirga terrestris]